MINLKVCGMKYNNNILEIGQILPDYMGFIFYKASPRYVGEEFNVPAGLPNAVKRVGVFVKESIDHMMALIEKHKLDYIQLHGHESVDIVKTLSTEGVRVIKVFSIDDQFDFTHVDAFKPYASYFLFDTQTPQYGGSGRSFSWDKLGEYDQEIPFFLSGGLSLANVAGIASLKAMNLHAIDVNSGFEVSPGVKDVFKVRELKALVDTWNTETEHHSH
jgi:phosphoribosylanthranilate isomerase